MRCKYEGDVSVSRKIWRCQHGTLTCYGEDGVTVSWTYEGAFVNGRMTGQGKTTWKGTGTPDDPGYIYDGAHVDGSEEGYGIWHRRDGTMVYKGNSEAGEYDGQGTSFRPDGTREYEGQWEKSCWRGVGTLYRPDGTISRNGTWVNGGSWEHKWQEEEMYWYEGDWDEENWMHGWGILYRPDRTTVEREGWWQNGEPVDGPPAGHLDAP